MAPGNQRLQPAEGLGLVVLAAGLGRRYGGGKQAAAVGPNGEWLLEYALHDALLAGFDSIVMVVPPASASTLHARLAPRLQGRAQLRLVEQSPSCMPPGHRAPAAREKPLGTGHALWCCRDYLNAPFAVINADDYYGRDTFRLIAEHLYRGRGPAMAAFRLDRTLSSHGGVNRGICQVDASGCLLGVSEYTDIRRRDSTIHGTSPNSVRTELMPDSRVSLNCWGLLPDLWPSLEAGLAGFLPDAGADDEYYLPYAVDRYLAETRQPLSVLGSAEEWMGLTYPEDAAQVAARLARLHADGHYPARLWTA